MGVLLRDEGSGAITFLVKGAESVSEPLGLTLVNPRIYLSVDVST